MTNQTSGTTGTEEGGAAQFEASYPKNRTELSGGPRLGLVGWARWVWRQLTSMRTALALLLLLAVAAIPGSIFPQRGVDAARVRRYIEDNPELSVWLDRLHLFDVYASPWFAAIYLLLMISLVGCILPRTKQHLTAIRAEPPRTPSRLGRMPARRHTLLDGDSVDAQGVVRAARKVLAGKRYRLRTEPDGALVVSAEKGYLKETGNLIFHVALLGVVVSIAVGHLFGWRAEIILKEGETFTTGVGSFDTIRLGPLVDERSIPVFSMRLDELNVSFESEAEGGQFGQPRQFAGIATIQTGVGSEALDPARTMDFAVNKPLHVDGVSIFLLGNGYAPVVNVRDSSGRTLFSDAVTFLPQDNNYSSQGVIKVPGARPELGFVGGFLPTLVFDEEIGPTSAFPDLADPALVLAVYEGDLFPEGRAQSVFSIDTDDMDQVMQDEDEESPFSLLLRPRDIIELPGDRGEIEFENVIRWGGLLVRHDPGRIPALAFSGMALAGLVLMLGVKRRRIFVRVDEGLTEGKRHTGVTVAGLPKGTDPGLDDLIDEVLDAIVTTSGGRSLGEKDETT